MDTAGLVSDVLLGVDFLSCKAAKIAGLPMVCAGVVEVTAVFDDLMC